MLATLSSNTVFPLASSTHMLEAFVLNPDTQPAWLLSGLAFCVAGIIASASMEKCARWYGSHSLDMHIIEQADSRHIAVAHTAHLTGQVSVHQPFFS